MRYRLEVMDCEPVIRNVETDVALGTVVGSGYDAKDPDLKANFDAVLTWDGEVCDVFPRQPLEHALCAIACHEARNGYPGFGNCVPGPNPARIEYTLGNLMADTASTLARGVVEWCRGGALRKETRDKFADLIVEIFKIRWASSFGSFNAETRRYEPYFVWSNQRMTFDAAARCYGMHELSVRFPDVDEAVLQELLSYVIKLLKQVTDHEMPVGARRVKQ